MTRVVTTPNAAASQTEHPARATVRTGLQAALLAFPILLALPEILAILDEELGVYLSDDARGWLALLAGVIAAGAAALARVMAIPAVEAVMRRIGLGAAPAESFLPDSVIYPPDGEMEDGWYVEGEDDGVEAADYDDFEVVDDAPAPTAGGLAESEPVEDEQEVVYDLDTSSLEQAAAAEVDLTPPPEGYEPRH